MIRSQPRDSFPHEHDLELRDLLVAITGHSIVAGYNKVIQRKLFVAVSVFYIAHRGKYVDKI